MEADFVGMKNGGVVLRDAKGKSFELPFDRFIPSDQKYLLALQAGETPPADTPKGNAPVTSNKDYQRKTVETLTNQVISLEGNSELHITGKDDPIAGSTIFFKSPSAWLFFDNIPAATVKDQFLSRIKINGKPAHVNRAGNNVRLISYGSGSMLIPHDDDFSAMTLYAGKSLTGNSIPLQSYTEYNAARLGKLNATPSSFVLKRGYMATLAQNPDGTGTSKNYVAQDHDIVINDMPKGLDAGIKFIRIFPWRWSSKKGMAGGIWQPFRVGWFYDWNIGANSNDEVEYVPIKQKKDWPSLDQDWKVKGSVHLLGFNEPDRPDQAKMSVEEAIAAWKPLMNTGLRLGSPAVSDGGLGWLYQFMDQAEAKNLRVDFVAVHYYRAVANPGDARGAAEQMYQTLKGIHERTKRPIWITEWNNGANWTTAPDPSPREQAEAIQEMIKMLDEAPFVERYAIFNWVEDCRHIINKDNSLTPSGMIYRDKNSPVSYSEKKEK